MGHAQIIKTQTISFRLCFEAGDAKSHHHNLIFI